MRIRKSSTNQVAKKYILEGGSVPQYHIWPSSRPRDTNGRKSNESQYALSFNTVEEAAAHLIANPRDQIRMQQPNALINEDVIIELGEDEPEPN